MDYDEFGTRMKLYEQPSTSRRAFKGQPIIARLDGKAFHTFTKGLKRPFDSRLSDLMVDTMRSLVDKYGAQAGYTQSDEITLGWYLPVDADGDYVFGGRFQKFDSLLAAHATAFFNSRLSSVLPEKASALPIFDCRTFTTPTLYEAYHEFLWRQQDATKNAISMAAQSMFPHKRLQGMNGLEMKQLMLTEKGVTFEDYPTFFRRGSFARRVREERTLTEAQMAGIPEQYRPTAPVLRSFIDIMDIDLRSQSNPVDVLFYGAEVEAQQPVLE